MAIKLTAAAAKTVDAAVDAAFAKDIALETYEARVEALALLDSVSTKPRIAVRMAEKYGVAVTEKVSDGRGAPKGALIYVFGSGDYTVDLVAGRASKTFRRLCNDAWNPKDTAADKDAAEELLKALERVVKGRAKLSVADRRKFAKLAAGVGVSFV